MKKLLWLTLAMLSLPSAAQTLYLYPKAPTPVRGMTQTVTAVVNGVNNKGGTWSVSGGTSGTITTYGVNPCTVNEPCVFAVKDTTAETVTLTFTPANTSVSASSSTIAFAASPTPIGTGVHPRLKFTAAMLPALQAKAATGTDVFYNKFSAFIAQYYFGTDQGIGVLTIDTPGTGWSVGDYFTIAGGTGGTGKVTAETGGVPSAIIIYNGGSNYATATGVATTGAAGRSGLTVNITQLWTFSTWSGSACTGGSGGPSTSQVNVGLEYHAFMYAWMSMMAPTSTLRNQYGCAARDIWVYDMPNVISGAENIGGNEWSDACEPYALTTDWIYNYLGSSDLTLAHQYSAFMLQYVLNVGYGITAPAGNIANYNTPNELPSATPGPYNLGQMRTYGNNYSQSKMLYLAGLSLTFDNNTTDDPTLTGAYNTCSAPRGSLCSDWTGGNLNAYFPFMVGGQLYNDYAHLEDPNVTRQAYNAAFSNVPAIPMLENVDGNSYPGFGDGRDGASSEGNWYPYSFYRLADAMTILHTTGKDDPILYGPQVSLESSSWMDMKYINDAEILTSQNINNYSVGGTASAYTYLTMGDSYTYYRAILDMETESALLYLDSLTGRTDRASALEWLPLNAAFGGPDGTQAGCTGSLCGFDNLIGNVNQSLWVPMDMFAALPTGDPVSSPPADPRPSMPLALYNGSLTHHAMIRNSWTNPTLFTYWYNDSFINHENQYDGRFVVYSNGEYITNGRTIFNNGSDVYMVSASQNNLPQYFNSTGSGCTQLADCTWWQQFTTGGQNSQGTSNGITFPLHSELPTYTAAVGDITGAYNGASATGTPYSTYNDITSASRDLVYLLGTKQVLIYDRVAVGHAASTQTEFLMTTGTITVSGNTATWLTQSGTQKGAYTSLLPTGGTLANNGFPCPGCVPPYQNADWEPAGQLQVTPSGTPTATQFLSLLQWGASSFTPATPSLVQSTAGQNFDGALIGSSLVMFTRSWPASFTGVTYPASGATTHYISDLTPNTTYTISAAGAPTSAATDTAGVLAFAATGTGNVTVGTASPSGSTTMSGGSISGAVIQ